MDRTPDTNPAFTRFDVRAARAAKARADRLDRRRGALIGLGGVVLTGVGAWLLTWGLSLADSPHVWHGLLG